MSSPLPKSSLFFSELRLNSLSYSKDSPRLEAALFATRSDREIFGVVIRVNPDDKPQQVGIAYQNAVALMEEFRTCECTKDVRCKKHEYIYNPYANQKQL